MQIKYHIVSLQVRLIRTWTFEKCQDWQYKRCKWNWFQSFNNSCYRSNWGCCCQKGIDKIQKRWTYNLHVKNKKIEAIKR